MFRQIDYSRYGRLGLSKLMQELIRRRLQEGEGRGPHISTVAQPKEGSRQ